MLNTKKCSKCKKDLDVTTFTKNRQQKSGLNPSCKICVAKVSKKYRTKNRDRINAKQREYRQNNLEEIRRKDRERNITSKRRAYKNARNRYHLVKGKSLSKKFLEEIEDIYRITKWISDYTRIPHEVDHIHPLQGKNLSGLHVPWNLQILSRFENRSKGTNLINS